MAPLVGVTANDLTPAAVEEEIHDDDHLALAGGIDVLHASGRLAELKNLRKFKDAFEVCRARIGGVVRPISYVFQSAGLTRTL
jgi:hypothetical protein